MQINSKSFFQPIDRVAIALMLLLSVLLGLLAWQGDAVAPRVRDFSWQNKQIGAEDTTFSLTFSRPMDTKSVEANLQIDPPLPGKISWAGRRMAYTLVAPAPYGTSYQLQLRFARDKFTQEQDLERLIQPFDGRFQTRDRAFIYLGVEEEEQGRLILYNFTQQQKTILTPKEMVVFDFKPYPTGEKILFSATERTSKQRNLISSQLYTVTTGRSSGNQDSLKNSGLTQFTNKPESPGKINLILDNKGYQNLKFDLSPDGKIIVVQRVNQRNPGEVGYWVLQDAQEPYQLKTQPGGDFIITPDSAAVAVLQGQGVAILPLQADATEPLDFLPQFGMVLDFSQDGTAAAMVKFNANDYTRSLFLIANQGVQKQLLRTTGSILSAQFDPRQQTLYCLLTQLLTGETYEEQPYLVAIDLKTGQQKPLLVFPNQRDIQMSLSPDGLGLLFDQVVTATTVPSSSANLPSTSDGQAIATSQLWLLPLPATEDTAPSTTLRPEQLPLPGLRPYWLP